MPDNKKPKFQPWNEEEFQADVFVRGMNHLQRWMYRTLLQAAFFHTTRPYLPMDDEVLWVLAGCESPEQWEQNKARVLKRFVEVEIDGINLYENRRVKCDWENLQEFRDIQSEKGRARATAAEREGGKFKSGVPVLLTASQPPAVAGTRLDESAESTSRSPAREVKVSEVKGREEKESSNTPTDHDSSTAKPLAAKAAINWHNMSTRHKRLLGKPVASPSRHKETYYEMSKRFTEEIVLECFENWAPSKRQWAEDPKSQPIYLFWKDLPDLAEDMVADRDAENQEKQLVEQHAVTEKQQQAEQEASIVRQAGENWKRLTTAPPPENGASVLEYLPELADAKG